MDCRCCCLGGLCGLIILKPQTSRIAIDLSVNQEDDGAGRELAKRKIIAVHIVVTRPNELNRRWARLALMDDLVKVL